MPDSSIPKAMTRIGHLFAVFLVETTVDFYPTVIECECGHVG
jgi:hypothetical protein